MVAILLIVMFKELIIVHIFTCCQAFVTNYVAMYNPKTCTYES